MYVKKDERKETGYKKSEATQLLAVQANANHEMSQFDVITMACDLQITIIHIPPAAPGESELKQRSP